MTPLPPLPEPAITRDRRGEALLIGPCYTAEQMLTLQRQTLEWAAKLCDEMSQKAVRLDVSGDTACEWCADAIRGKA